MPVAKDRAKPGVQVLQNRTEVDFLRKVFLACRHGTTIQCQMEVFMTRLALAFGFLLSLSSFAMADVGPPPDLGNAHAPDLATAPTGADKAGCNLGGGAASGAAIFALLGLLAARRASTS